MTHQEDSKGVKLLTAKGGRRNFVHYLDFSFSAFNECFFKRCIISTRMQFVRAFWTSLRVFWNGNHTRIPHQTHHQESVNSVFENEAYLSLKRNRVIGFCLIEIFWWHTIWISQWNSITHVLNSASKHAWWRHKVISRLEQRHNNCSEIFRQSRSWTLAFYGSFRGTWYIVKSISRTTKRLNFWLDSFKSGSNIGIQKRFHTQKETSIDTLGKRATP